MTWGIPLNDTSAMAGGDGGHKVESLWAFGRGSHETDKVQGSRGAGLRHYRSDRMEPGHAVFPGAKRRTLHEIKRANAV